jgi:UDP-glucose 4-epimerase
VRVLVTGGAGFIGAHVVRALLAGGHEPVVLDRLDFGVSPLLPHVPVVHGDVADPKTVLPKLPPVHAVIHLAAQISVPKAEAEPLGTVRDNVDGTVGAFSLALSLGAAEFRWASSAAVYGDPDGDLPLRETSPVRPQGIYGLTKWTGERLVDHLGRHHGLRVVTLRLANVYGPGQRTAGEGGVVARFVEALAAGDPLVREGDGEQTRDFIYVADVARAFVHRLGATPSLVLNIGTGEATSVNRLGELLAQVAERPLRWQAAPPRPADIRASVFDPDPARQWGFAATTPLTEGLRQTWMHWR